MHAIPFRALIACALSCVIAMVASAASPSQAAAPTATPPPAAPAKPPADAKAAKPRFGIDTQIAVLMEDPAAKAVMDKHFPQLRENPHYFMLEDMSVRQLAPMSNGKLTEEKLAKIDAELAAIP